MRLQALPPLLVHRGEPRSALVIGLGTGIRAGALWARTLARVLREDRDNPYYRWIAGDQGS
jgi:hypothetical protein